MLSNKVFYEKLKAENGKKYSSKPEICIDCCEAVFSILFSPQIQYDVDVKTPQKKRINAHKKQSISINKID